MKLILLGPPGAGKGTQAATLSERFNLLHLATGDILREATASGTSLGNKAKKYMDSGALVPDAIVVGLLEGKMKLSDNKDRFILDGFPRNVEQAKQLEEFTEINLLLFIDVDFDKLLERATGRRVCKKCGQVYHEKNNPPRKPNVCNRDGGPLFQRDDDKVEVVKNRLKTYERQTKPVIAYYDLKGKLAYVNGNYSIEEVRENLIHALEDRFDESDLSVKKEVAKTAGEAAADRGEGWFGKAKKKDHGTRRQRGKGRRGKGGGKKASRSPSRFRDKTPRKSGGRR